MFFNKNRSFTLSDLISIACIVGFIGDALLQFGIKVLHLGGKTGWGLKSYFLRHGQAESMFTAAGMMTLFYVLYIYLVPFPVTYLYLAIYGIVVDLIFRQMMIFSSLTGYYEYFGYIGSAFWMAFPMMIPLFIFDALKIINVIS